MCLRWTYNNNGSGVGAILWAPGLRPSFALALMIPLVSSLRIASLSWKLLTLHHTANIRNAAFHHPLTIKGQALGAGYMRAGHCMRPYTRWLLRGAYFQPIIQGRSLSIIALGAMAYARAKDLQSHVLFVDLWGPGSCMRCPVWQLKAFWDPTICAMACAINTMAGMPFRSAAGLRGAFFY